MARKGHQQAVETIVSADKPSVALAQYWQGTFRRRRRFFVAAGGAILTIFLLLGAFNIAYAEKIFPGVTVGSIAAGGMSKEQLSNELHKAVEAVSGQALVVTIDSKEFTVTPTTDWRLSYDIDRTVAAAFAVGRPGDLARSLGDQLAALFGGLTVPGDYTLDPDRYHAWVGEVTAAVEEPEQDARLVLHGEEIVVEEEKAGRRIAGDGLDVALRRALTTIDLDVITLSSTEVHPAVTAAMARTVKPVIAKMITTDLILTFGDRTFKLATPDLVGFFELAADRRAPEAVAILVNESKILQTIERLAQEIDQEAVDARLSLADGRATVFTPSQDGYRVKREEAAKAIADALEQRRNDISVTKLELAVEITKPAVRTETINDLGIKELVGKATTSFAGSPPNRVHNITIGAKSFHGLLIKPGETFSTVTALGNIDASTGYRAELVIKEDRLIPETGGGLCQVSTTLFRTVLNAGLPIVERTNHSFRVRYYEPPVGMDATIYDPAPDFKFTNDTPGYLLIQSSVEGTKITFEFYGTKDGRVATTTTPVVYNVTQPGDPVYIEDASLAPGEQKQIEKPVPGADARFTYTVKRGGETIFQRTYTSHYVAWRAKYLVGPAAPPAEEPGTAGESTAAPPEPAPSPPAVPTPPPV